MTRPRFPWFVAGYLLGVASMQPGLAVIARDMGRATHAALGLAP